MDCLVCLWWMIDLSIIFEKLFLWCRGKVVVPKGKVLTFQGIGNPVLSYDDAANLAGSTSKSASTVIEADDFIASGVTFQVLAPHERTCNLFTISTATFDRI